MSFAKILENLCLEDKQLREEADQTLQKYEKQNLPMYLINLVVELANESRATNVRQMAGIRLKNSLSSRTPQKTMILNTQWKSLGEDVKKKVTLQLLHTLHSKLKEARKTAAQVLAALACIELPEGNWYNIIDTIVENVIKPKSQFGVESSLVALGYICEEPSVAKALKVKTNVILTAVIQAMKDKNVADITLAGTVAFFNSLEFIKGNFEKKQERDYIMKVVCSCTQHNDVQVRKAAVECLVKIAYLYYPHISSYMEAVFKITGKAAKSDKEEVALQAIEFWTTLAELETEIIEEIAESTSNGEEPPRKCFYFVKSAIKLNLIDLLVETLCRQEEEQTEEDWNISASAATCLTNVSKLVREEIIEKAMPFITKNIASDNWRLKEASTLAFSCILEGPSSGKMSSIIEKALPYLLKNTQSDKEIVRDTAVFTIGRIARYHAACLLKDDVLDEVMKTLLNATNSSPRVASKSCWAIHFIAESIVPEDGQESSKLSKYFETLVKQLLKVAERTDSDEGNLRINSFAALSSVISNAPRDTYGMVEKLLQMFMQRLKTSLESQTLTQKDKEVAGLVQSHIIGILQTLTQKMGVAIKKYSDPLMKLYLGVLATKNITSYQETLMAVGSLITALGKDFSRYMQSFAPFLYLGLKNYRETEVCASAVNLTSDLATALETELTPYCDEIISILLQALQSPLLDRSIKPTIISSFGDIALAIGKNFVKYLTYVGEVLKHAGDAKFDNTNEDMVDYVNFLRENVFAAYSGILQGLKSEKWSNFNPYVDNLMACIRRISKDDTIDAEVFKNCVTVIGDLANVYGSKIKNILRVNYILKIVDEAAKSKDPETKKEGLWTRKQLENLGS